MKRHRDFRLTDMSHLAPRREYLGAEAPSKGKCACGEETTTSVSDVGWICLDCKRKHDLPLMHALAAQKGPRWP